MSNMGPISQAKTVMSSIDGENTSGHSDPASMREYARNRIRMLEAARLPILCQIESLMQQDEALQEQIERHQGILGQYAVKFTVIEGGKS